jgi:hypothetical protein
VRVVADLGEEEPRERRPVAPPHALVVQLPPARVDQVRGPVGGGVEAAVVLRRPVHGGGGDRHDTGDPVRVPCRGQQPVPGAVAQPHHEGPVDADGVHHRQQVAHREQVGVVLGTDRSVAEAVAARVDDHDPVVTCQVGHLGLPHPGVDDGVGRREDDRARAVAVDLVVDADAVALDERRGAGLPCLHRFLPGPAGPSAGSATSVRAGRCKQVARRPTQAAAHQASTSRRDHHHGHRHRQADGVRRPVRRRPGRHGRGRERRPRRPARALPGPRHRARHRERARPADRHRRPLRDGVAPRPGCRRVRRVRRGRRPLLADRGEGVRAHRPRRPALPAGCLRAGPGLARRRAADGEGLHDRGRSGLARARRPGLLRLREVLPSRLPRPPGGRVDPGARRCPGQARVGSTGGRHRLRARGQHRADGGGLSRLDVPRLRLPRGLRRAGEQAGLRGRCRGARDLRGRRGPGVLRLGLRPGHQLRLPARHG